MKNLLKRNISVLLIAFIVMFAALIGYLVYTMTVYGERWFVTPYNPRLQNMKTTIEPGNIYDRKDRALVYTKGDGRAYISNDDRRKAVAHIIGDSHGMTYGAQTFYAKYLFGFDKDTITRISDLITGEERHGSDVVLTIDAKLSARALDALGGYNGAVVVMNYKTGEILASVSAPTFDPANMDKFLEGGGESELVNRAFVGLYPPGSTFKLITAAAMIENGMADFKTHCDGATEIAGEEINCWNDHGDVDLPLAIEDSCNVYFAEAVQELGTRAVQTKAEKFLYNQELLFEDVVMGESVYEATDNAVNAAWSSIGQYHDLVTPLHACMIAGCIANDGVMMEPKLLLKVKDGARDVFEMTPEAAARPMRDVSMMQDMMLRVVTDGTGRGAHIDGVTVAGKTGTAEITGDEENAAHAWFVGYIADEDHPLCIAVIMEKAGSGGNNAAPAAQKVLSSALELGY